VFSTTRELPAITTLELPAITDEYLDKRGSTLGRALRNPVYRSGYALVINTAGSTAVGVAYWALAARLYGKAYVGRSSALIAALILLSSLTQLNLASALPRFLPQAGRRASRFIASSYGVSTLAALVASVGFVILMPRLSAQWQFLASSPALAFMFIGAALLWGVFALEDAALTGLHKAVVVPLENTVYGVLKLGLLAGVAVLLPATGIFVSWVVPLVLVIPVINWLIFSRYARDGPFGTNVSTVTAREVVRFASIDYLGALLSQAYGSTLPLLVLSVLGAAANGSFYIAWTIASGLSLVPANFGTSLMVEATAAPHRLAELTRGVLVRSLAVTGAGAVVLAVLARPVLSVYGAGYTSAAPLLAVLAAATLPRLAVQLTWSLDRIAGRVGRAAVTQLALAVLVLGGSWFLVHPMGAAGVGVAWIAGNLIVAVIRLPTIVGAVRGRSARAVQRRPKAGHRGGGHSRRAVPPRRAVLVYKAPAVAHAKGGRGPGRHRASSR
jgi:O-antigen/teichoic acid export membrane protein